MRVSQHELITILRNSLTRAGLFNPEPSKAKMPKDWVLLRRETQQSANERNRCRGVPVFGRSGTWQAYLNHRG